MNHIMPSVSFGALSKNPSRLVGGRFSSFDAPLTSLTPAASSSRPHPYARMETGEAPPVVPAAEVPVTPEARMVNHMHELGVSVYTLEGCGWCTKMKTEGHGIDKLIKKLVGAETMSNNQKPSAFPCTDFGNGVVAVGYKPIAGLYDLFLQSMVTHMKEKGVKIHAMDGCPFCTKLKQEGAGIERLFVPPNPAGQDAELVLSDKSKLEGYPTADFGNGTVVKGYLPLSIRNAKNPTALSGITQGLYERFLASVQK